MAGHTIIIKTLLNQHFSNPLIIMKVSQLLCTILLSDADAALACMHHILPLAWPLAMHGGEVNSPGI
jgi:hypothetical protein